MANLAPINIHVANPDDRNVFIDRKFPLKVNSKGVFFVEISDDDAPSLTNHGHNKNRWEVNRNDVNFLVGSSVEAVTKILTEWLRDEVRASVTTRTLILYNFSGVCPHVDDNGVIRRNGNECDDYNGLPGNPWRGEGSFHNSAREIGFAASIIVEQVTSLANGIKSYKYITVNKDDLGVHGNALQRWTVGVSHGSYRGAPTTAEHVPYTEKNAKFFDDLIMSMTKLYVRMDDFFSMDDVQSMINHSNGLITLPENNRKAY